ncbi:glycosyl hydrolase [Pedobacter sp. Leaf194]|nr:glycosyl hydrolase [Pedobacter sp. Leaf194]
MKDRHFCLKGSTLAICLILFLSGCWTKRSFDSLNAGFKNPPNSSKPGVYWYFMDGNISKSGITKDLEAMKTSGIGSVIFLEVNVGIPRGNIDFLSEKWQNLFTFAVDECERLGIEMTLGVGPGWTGSGGPWVKLPQSMQHLVASTTRVSGGTKEIIKLPIPDPKKPYFGKGTFTPELEKQWRDFYEDVAVLAFQTPDTGPKIDDADEKALYYRAPYSSVKGTKQFLPSVAAFQKSPIGTSIPKNGIIDLTHLLQQDGVLNWNPPTGNWTIMRFGRRNNGAVTRPAPVPGLGFEADKFDTAAIKSHLDNYAGKLIGRAGKPRTASAGGLTMLHMDSWEMGAQNWTPKFREEFKTRRGYDPQPFYPVYLGNIVESREISERFLWDLRQTAMELVLENHAGYIKKYAKEYGLGLSIEPYDMNPTADMELGSIADVVMAEFWSPGFYNTSFGAYEASSIAHIKGQSLVPAEAFTAGKKEGFTQYPGSMKNQTDWAFGAGINKLYFHTFQHQSLPDNLKPGMTMGQYGVHWDRNQTWWPMVGAYHDYVSRSQFLLQQGRNVADVLYLSPEGSPHVFKAPDTDFEGEPYFPDKKGYGFDGCAPSQLYAAKVVNSRIVFPSGAGYKILVMPFSYTITPRLLQKIYELIKSGATVVGIPPKRAPGLTDFPNSDVKIKSLVQKIWNTGHIPGSQTQLNVGKGKIIWGGDINFKADTILYPKYQTTAKILETMKVSQDFTTKSGGIRYGHRTSKDFDIYFVANRTNKQIIDECTFRTAKGKPQLWNAVSGEIRALPQFQQANGKTTIPMTFNPYESFFIVFAKHSPSNKISDKDNFPKEKELLTFSGSWEVSFDPKWGGPEKTVFDKLHDWAVNPDKGIKYYSGIANYTKNFSFSTGPETIKGHRLLLDLGEVKNMATVRLNGKEVGTVWTDNALDITDYIKNGDNILEIAVANLWPNRLIGDQALPDDGVKNGKWPEWLLKGQKRPGTRLSFVAFQHYTQKDQLLKSGLLGPVKILLK